jgi:hypothetical protein
MNKKYSGDKYYYLKGQVRLLAKLDESTLRAIKVIAIEQNKSIMEVATRAIEEFLGNTKVLNGDFLPDSNGSFLKTFIPKEIHKRLKIVAVRDFGKKLGDLSGAVLSRWAKEKSNEAWPTTTTSEGSAEDFVEKVQKAKDTKEDANGCASCQKGT